ncbi:hypothetical protein EHS25_000503 [Saitozyma podzolica]|uniref:DRBM domain-containing protein n=1 Tax=Saitozyma podzolica TaxID=1890683 RepID=A0A427YWB2_9TREE|nr:hypothetical protein EHS25_000503 [Saitozyma podzolica]
MVIRKQRVDYEYARSSGTPDHAPLFTATGRVYSDSEVIHVTSAKETSKKAAANKAAYEMCLKVGLL